MKKRKKIMSFSEIVTLIVTIVGFIWLGAVKISGLEHNVQEINKRLDKMDSRLERIEEDVHQMDVRVNILEQRKP